MKYVCIDRGSQRCPCHLMAVGQCYTCTMVRDGICSCEDAAGWQGVCPWTEYMQQGERDICSPSDCLSELNVLSKISFAEGLHVLRLAVSAGFAGQCRRPGAYLMAEALGYRTPLSVLRVQCKGRGGDCVTEEFGEEDAGSIVEVAVKEIGPKSHALIMSSDGDLADGQMQAVKSDGEAGRIWRTAVWRIAGPYYNGLLNSELLEPGRPVLVIARGTGIAPFINIRNDWKLAGSEIELYLDDASLPESFLEEYLEGQVWQRIRLTEEQCLEAMRLRILEAVQEKQPWNVLVLVSPYFAGRLTADLSPKQKAEIVVPNSANLCCGMGICGACSHTDEKGITVRLCKCNRTVIE